MLVVISLPAAENECQLGVDSFCGGSVSYTAMNCIALFLNWGFNWHCFQYIFVYNFTKLHALSHRCYIFLACSSRVDTLDSAFCCTTRSLLRVFHIKISSFQIPTAMSDSECLHMFLVGLVISSKDESVFIGDLSNPILQIVLDAS